MANSSSSTNRRGVMFAAIAAMLVLAIGIVAWRASANRPPSLDASPERIRQFVATDAFRDLPKDEKARYVDAMHRGFEAGGPDDKAIRNMAELHRQQMLDEYFALPEGKPRLNFLDRKIDEMERIRKMMENPATQPGENRVVIRRGGPSAAAQKEMAETVPAEYQSKMAQYIKDMKDRRAARGLPVDGPVGIMIRVQKSG